MISDFKFAARCKKFSAQILGVLILCTIGYIAYYIISSTDAQTRASIIALVGTVSIAVFTLTKQRQKDLDQKIREQKLPSYENIFNLFKSILSAVHEKEELSERDILRQYREISYAIVLNGSESIIKSWSDYHRWMSEQDINSADDASSAFRIWGMRIRLGRLMKEIRKDIGHDDKNLTEEMIADLLLPLQADAREEIISRMLAAVSESDSPHTQ